MFVRKQVVNLSVLQSTILFLAFHFCFFYIFFTSQFQSAPGLCNLFPPLSQLLNFSLLMLSLLFFVLGLIPALVLWLPYMENLSFFLSGFSYAPFSLLQLISSFFLSYPFQASVLILSGNSSICLACLFSHLLLLACLFVYFSFILSVFYKSLGLCDWEHRKENLVLLISSTWMWYGSVN